MTTNSLPKPLKEALRLRKQIDATRQRRSDQSREHAAAEERIRALETERVDAYTRVAQGTAGAQKDAERIERELNAVRRSIESFQAAVAGTMRAEQQATEELGELLQRELPAFADAAEEDTQEAIAAFEAMETAYREAYNAWVRAQQAWAPLHSATFQMFRQTTEAAGLYLPDAELIHAAGVPAWPLPLPDELFPLARMPRPAAFEPQNQPPTDDDDV
jgi:chromosome segregation ATPase